MEIVSRLCTGEYGDQATGKSRLLEGEEPVSMTDASLVELLAGILQQAGTHPVAAEYTLTALLKLTSRLPQQSARIQARLPSVLTMSNCAQFDAWEERGRVLVHVEASVHGAFTSYKITLPEQDLAS